LDYRDLWYGNQFHSYPTMWHKHKHKQLEHETLSRAAKITVTNRRIKERMMNTYHHLDFRDVVIIPHGWDAADFGTDNGERRTENGERAFRLTYTGTFYDVITPVPFFKAVKRLRKVRPDIKLELHFAGTLRDEYKKKARRMKLDDIIVDHDYLPHRESVRLLTQSDALWMMVGETRNADTISSAKLYEYFGSRKPLLVSVPEGALRKDAERYGAAWITDPDDESAIMTAIQDMYERWSKGLLPAPDEGVVMLHQRTVQTAELARTLATALRVV
jgi:glycosyltransferase involved in cell wall biosynthesis